MPVSDLSLTALLDDLPRRCQVDSPLARLAKGSAPLRHALRRSLMRATHQDGAGCIPADGFQTQRIKQDCRLHPPLPVKLEVPISAAMTIRAVYGSRVRHSHILTALSPAAALLGEGVPRGQGRIPDRCWRCSRCRISHWGRRAAGWRTESPRPLAAASPTLQGGCWFQSRSALMGRMKPGGEQAPAD